MTITAVDTDLDFSEIHERMQWYVDQKIIPHCSTLILKGTDVVDVSYHGSMDHEGGRPLGEDAIYRMHSSTKIITAVAAMMLYEEGKFELDDPIAKYLPEFSDMSALKADAKSADDVEPANGPMLINQIFSHTAGLSYGFPWMAAEWVIDQIYTDAQISPFAMEGRTLDDLCQSLGKLPLAYQPGTQSRYSLSTDVLARLVEVLSGQTFDAFLKERILGPLNMVDTDFHVPTDKMDRFTTMYQPANPLDPMAPGCTSSGAAAESMGAAPTTFSSGGAGLLSTLPDFLKLTQMLINRGTWDGHQFLKPETLDLMCASQFGPGVHMGPPFVGLEGNDFGLGLGVKTSLAEGEPSSMLGEFHWGGIAGSHVWISPKANLAGICITQMMPAFWHPFSLDFKRLAYQLAGE